MANNSAGVEYDECNPRCGAAGGDRNSISNLPDRHSPAPAPFKTLRRNYYAAIAADPASHFSSYTAIQSQNPSSRRDNERHYKTMSLEGLAALPVRDLANPDGCHLFIWTSGPFLLHALYLIEAWGFRYSTRAFTWLKTKRLWDGISPLHANLR